MTRSELTFVYLPETSKVKLSRFGRGNYKIGTNVYTYSRLPGNPSRQALGITGAPEAAGRWAGTCPGATPECEAICYARRPVEEVGPVASLWLGNSARADVPPIPADAKLLRIHVSGDFDSTDYIDAWIDRLKERPDVRAWAYTRSWRVPSLLCALEDLRALPNMQLFASMDPSSLDMPPVGWRRAWLDRTVATGVWGFELRLSRPLNTMQQLQIVFGEGTSSYVCPEETGHKPNCEACRYCFDGRKHDVTFLEH